MASSAKDYEIFEKLGEGTYGCVYKIQTKDGKFRAMKKWKCGNKADQIISQTELREITILRTLKHPNVIPLEKVEIDRGCTKIFMPLADGSLDHLIIIGGLKDPKMIKIAVYQIVKAIAYVTSMNILHRDLKPQNILYEKVAGHPFRMWLADFGMGRADYCFLIPNVTQEVVSLWYRAPEILLGGKYCESAEVWALGCIIAEIVDRVALFRGDYEHEQLQKIFRLLGTPTEESWPGVTSFPYWRKNFPKLLNDFEYASSTIKDADLFCLLEGALALDPKKRSSIFEIQNHRYFDEVRDYVDKESPYACPLAIDLAPNLRAKTRDIGIDRPVAEESKLSKKNRLTLFEWLIELKEAFRLKWHSLFLGIKLFNLYASIKTLKISEIQLYGVACLKLASDFHEIYSISDEDWIDYTVKTYTTQQLAEACQDILKTVKCNVFLTTPVDYLLDYLRFYDDMIRKDAFKYLKTSLGCDASFTYSSEDIAFACIYLNFNQPPPNIIETKLRSIFKIVSTKTPRNFKHRLTKNIELCAQMIKSADKRFV